MAAITVAVAGTGDTTATPNASPAFTPAENDLLVVFVQASNTLQNPGTISNSQGITFTQFAFSPYTPSNNHSLYGFVANSLVTLAQAVSQTVTADFLVDNFTGTVISVARISGMPAAGLTAIRQFKVTKGDATTPVLAFDEPVGTGNPTLVACAGERNPPALTPPTGWTEGGDAGYDTPTCGMEWAYRDSGFTGTTVTWGSSDANQFGVIIVELAANAAPTWDAVPTMASQTSAAYTLNYDGSAGTTAVYFGAYPRNATAPTAAQLKAGTGAHGTATEDPTDAADSIVLTPSDTPKSPWYDIYGVLEGPGGFSSVQTLPDELLDIPTGEGRVTLTSIAALSFAEDIGTVINDIITWVIDTDPGLYDSSISASGQVSYPAGGDTSRQTGLARRFIDSTSAYANGGDQYQWVINNLAPVPVTPPLVFDDPLLYRKSVGIAALDLRTLVNDPESDTVVVTALDALPPGLAVTASVLDDTGAGPTTYGTTNVDFQFLDSFGATYVEEAIFQIGDLVPNEVGATQAAAIAAIEAIASFTTTVVTQYHASIVAGKVISHNPVAGILLAPGSNVELLVSLGPAVSGVNTPNKRRKNKRMLFEPRRRVKMGHR